MQKILQPWAMAQEEVLEKLETNPGGLSQEESDKRIALYGKNTFHAREKKNPVKLFLKQFVSPLIFLLVGAAFITGILHEWIDTSVIAFAVFINVGLGFYHEYHAESTIERLTTYIKDRTRVFRDGREEEIDSSLLVPGDLIQLSYGSRIPADARIIDSNNLRVDEAVLTGESLPIEKVNDVLPLGTEVAERKNIAHAGTLVVEGYATAIVYVTGNNTEIGKIAGIVSKIERTKTPLQKGVDHFAWLIFLLTMIVVVGIWVLGISRGEPALPMLVLSAAVAVGAVPEALPIVLTVILAVGATRIASKKGIVRKLAAAETLGSTTLIMTDKTGTLTKADMQLVGIYTSEVILSKDSDTLGAEKKTFGPSEKKVLELALSNVDISIDNPNDEKEKWTFHGRPFEVNIAKSAINHAVNTEILLMKDSPLVIPFNSTNKFSVSLVDEHYVMMGAPDILLKKSDVSKEDYVKFEDWIDKTSRSGKRIIGLARMKKSSKAHLKVEDVKDLEFLGMLIFFDPVREEVPEVIKNIESHGMKMVLVTGDLVGTAMSVAKSLDWNVKEDQVLAGSELHKLSDEELLKIIPDIKIFARVTPEDKLRIGMLYRKLGEIVAMTGDGVNDAPALKAVDIGISLGSGSDVAKSAADLVLLDDNFETISLAINEGRKILSNIRKSFVYLVSNSFDEVFVVGGSLIAGIALPLTALQIIWVNLFTGSLSGLAFAFDEDIDHERYKGRDIKLVFTKQTTFLTLFIGIVTSTLLFLMYYFLLRFGVPVDVARSVFFVCFSGYILAITYSFRSLRSSIFKYPLFTNKKLNWSIVFGFIVLIITMTVPFLRNLFSLAPLPMVWIPFVFFWLLLNVFIVEGSKYLARKISL